MARVITHHCDRCSLQIPTGVETHPVPPFTLKDNDGRPVFHHAGFPEICGQCNALFEKTARALWKTVKGRKNPTKKTAETIEVDEDVVISTPALEIVTNPVEA